MSDDQEVHGSKQIPVYGDKHSGNREAGRIAFMRYIDEREVTFTCDRCKQSITQWRYPSRTPKYCDECRPLVRKDQIKERVRRSREREKQRKAQQ